MMEICDNARCTGCTVCSLKCPQRAISMQEVGIHGIIAVVNDKLCIKCGLCRKVCPVNATVRGNYPQKVFAGWSRDQELLNKSSSGGVATEIANYIIMQKGVVYGVKQTQTGEYCHSACLNQDELKCLIGSKYVQSDLGNMFQLIRDDLNQNRKVLFIGTGCQVAGLKRYIGNNDSNLVTVDLICHGTPCPQFLREHINSIVKKAKSSEMDVTFRENGKMNLVVRDEKGVLYNRPFYKDIYYLGFELGLLLKSSCFTCQYTNIERNGDITLGDFHGLGAMVPTRHTTQYGNSLILVNSSLGENLLSDLHGKIELEEHSISEALSCNPQLSQSTKKHAGYGKFVELFQQYGFEYAASKVLVKDRIKYWLINELTKYSIVRRVVYKLKGK